MDTHLTDQVPLFSSLAHDERHKLEDFFTQKFAPAGDVICHEGDPGESFFVILSGKVGVVKALGTHEERLFSYLTGGDYLGEMSLLEKQGVRSASVRAITDVQYLEMTRSDFNSMIQRWPSLALEMLREMSLRLRQSEQETIRDLQIKNIELTQAYQDLQAAQAQIIEKEKLERELQVARRIQSSFLPGQLPQVAGYDFGARILPARAVGGDLYDLIPLESGRIGVLIGDVSDKGVPAALFMALTRSLLRVEAMRYDDPVRLLQQVNRHLIGMSAERTMFVTVLYGILDTLTGEFHYARAGHELPIVFESEHGLTTPSYRPGQMLGVFPEPAIDEHTLHILPGGVVLLYTDGVTDAMNKNEEILDRDGLLAALLQHKSLSAQGLCDQLMNTILAYQGEVAQVDDITIVAICANSSAP